MSHYEERLDNDLQRIRAEVNKMAQLVEQAVQNAVHALLTGNDELASATILADGHINRAMRHIDSLCHRFIAVHLPSAGPLRLISSVFRSNILLERIGDYAVTICREMFQLSGPIDGDLAHGIEAMSTEAQLMLRQAVRAFESGNADLARGTMVMAAQVQTAFTAQFAQLLDESAAWPLQDRFAVFVVCHRLERLSDQAKNLCEEAVFWSTGETKAKKVYRVLFLDEDNGGLSQMARAIAQKHYAELGEFYSAGREAAPALLPVVDDYLQERGLISAPVTPRKIDFTPAELADFHVIVSLQGVAKDYFEAPPFHSILLNWDVLPVDRELTAEALEQAYRALLVRVKDLMIELRGEDAL